MSEQFLVGAIIAKLPPSWRGYRKKILHRNEEISLEEILKHLRIEEESRSRDLNDEKSNGETSKANVVANPPNKGKGNGKNKGKGYKLLGPMKNKGQFKSSKGPCFACGKNGHFARDCRFKRGHNNEANVNSTQEELVATLSEVNAIHGKVSGW